MYKQQKPLTIQSGIIALILTAVVLGIAATTNAQTTTEAGTQAPERREALDSPNSPVVLQASSSSSTSTPTNNMSRGEILNERLMNRQAELARKQAELSSTTAARKSILSERAQMNIIQLSSRAIQRLSETISRLRSVSTEIRSKVSILDNQGETIDPIIILLDRANENLTFVERSLQNIDVDISYFISSATPKSEWQNTRETLSSIFQELTETSSLLRQATFELRNVVKSSSSTTTVSG